MTTEERLFHSIVADAIAQCRVPVSSPTPSRSEFDPVLVEVLEAGLPVAREQLGLVARLQRAEERCEEYREDAEMYREQRNTAIRRAGEVEQQLGAALDENDELKQRLRDVGVTS